MEYPRKKIEQEVKIKCREEMEQDPLGVGGDKVWWTVLLAQGENVSALNVEIKFRIQGANLVPKRYVPNVEASWSGNNVNTHISIKYKYNITYRYYCDNMPRGDRTGPDGYGPMTGRALGHCAGYASPGFTKGRGMGRGQGRGFGRGFGRGSRGRRFFSRRAVPMPAPIYDDPYYEPRYEYSRDDELEDLKQYAEDLKKELENIESRVKELSEKE